MNQCTAAFLTMSSKVVFSLGLYVGMVQMNVNMYAWQVQSNQ